MATDNVKADSAADVPYQSLYRRFRPQRFDELRGQPHVARALRNAVRDGRVGHAYLFSGPRGTGKTSAARILAKALNCANPIDGEPCGICASCVAITAGTSFDVHELDAASSNSVDAMRDLIARAALATPGNWKVYIVDEVHMLSNAASNALLKTLEEPPGHVVFVLATTDPQKLLATIKSRSQHFEFHLLAESDLSSLLEDVAQKADLELPSGALTGAVRRAKGSARDALSALDQIAAAGEIDEEADYLFEVIEALSSQSPQVLEALDRAFASGRDARQLAVELVERLRAGFLVIVRREEPSADDSLVNPQEISAIRSLGVARCVRTIELLGLAIVAMRDAPEPRITFEVALVRASNPDAEASTEALLDRIERLEARLAEITTQLENTPRPVVAVPSPSSARTTAPATSSDPASRPSLGAIRRDQQETSSAPGLDGSTDVSDDVEVPTTVTEVESPATPAPETPAASGALPSRDDIVKAWGDHILIGLRARVRAVYNVGRFTAVEGSDAVFALPNEAHVSHAEPLKHEVAEALSQYFATRIGLQVLVDSAMPIAPAEESPDEVVPTNRQRRSSRPSTPRSATEPVRELDDFEQVVTDDDTSAADHNANGTSNEGIGIAWAEDRLLQAFPGAEEV